MCYNSGRPRFNPVSYQTGPDGPWNKYYCPYCGSENMEYVHTHVGKSNNSSNVYKCRDCKWNCILEKMLRENQRNLLIRRKKLIKLNEN